MKMETKIGIKNKKKDKEMRGYTYPHLLGEGVGLTMLMESRVQRPVQIIKQIISH